MKVESLCPNLMGMDTNYIIYNQLIIIYNMNSRKLIVTSLTVIDSEIRINAYQEGENPTTVQEIAYNGTLQDIYNEVMIGKTMVIVPEANNYKWAFIFDRVEMDRPKKTPEDYLSEELKQYVNKKYFEEYNNNFMPKMFEITSQTFYNEYDDDKDKQYVMFGKQYLKKILPTHIELTDDVNEAIKINIYEKSIRLKNYTDNVNKRFKEIIKKHKTK